MNKISVLINKIEKLETELATEEKNILEFATLKLKSKLADSDVETLTLQKKIIDKQENDFKSLGLTRQSAIKKLDALLEELIGKKYTLSDSEHAA